MIENPFSLVRASDYTNEQINSLWVELGDKVVNVIIEPRSRISKYILGSKGSGKTHLLRYYSYPAVRLRSNDTSSLKVVKELGFLAVFIRATGLDAARFEVIPSGTREKWQQLFSVYLELRLIEGLVESLVDIKKSSQSDFNDSSFLSSALVHVSDSVAHACETLEEFLSWVITKRREIDEAINNVAFTGELDLKVPFSLGALCIPVSKAVVHLNSDFADFPIIYLIDEIENLSEKQQEVVNSLIRYGEGGVSFRVTGRLYSRKTLATLFEGEENREGAEFTTVYLDRFLQSYSDFSNFSKRFVVKRLCSSGVAGKNNILERDFDPSELFESISSENLFSDALGKANLHLNESDILFNTHNIAQHFLGKDITNKIPAENVFEDLVKGFPFILAKLNILIFFKKYKGSSSAESLAIRIRKDALSFLKEKKSKKSYYATAYSHYAYDLFAQLCRESKSSMGVPYAGFDTFVQMSSGNLRNLLIILGKLYSIAEFKGIGFFDEKKLPISLQTEAARESAQFLFESDTNFGRSSDQARDAVARLAELLRTARFSINIPEVSPLSVSFSASDLNEAAKKNLHNALNYSFVFQVASGRADRNSNQIKTKIQLNPLLSPRWGLPIYRRGDLGLNKSIANAIFDPDERDAFDTLLRKYKTKWNTLAKTVEEDVVQGDLFS